MAIMVFSRKTWFIVMHLTEPELTELLDGPAILRQREADGRKSAMPRELAGALAAHLVEVFQGPGLSGLGVKRRWKLGGGNEKRVALADWDLFQRRFCNGWDQWVGSQDHEFRRKHRPFPKS
ncbi:hypothetical protein K470DRAFT_273090 [Piedraia hortae CBS 480.64]|uniref:Uncharacterized protein n=1 Tax=Piedraia hortae CBS 480.64 TaxID=1314780 RepID=A0A6A7BRI3_9PEZI|nr:hypothetical protein K470DRAFT_273090 [Piedraia hortae CBS 480.64]